MLALFLLLIPFIGSAQQTRGTFHRPTGNPGACPLNTQCNPKKCENWNIGQYHCGAANMKKFTFRTYPYPTSEPECSAMASADPECAGEGPDKVGQIMMYASAGFSCYCLKKGKTCEFLDSWRGSKTQAACPHCRMRWRRCDNNLDANGFWHPRNYGTNENGSAEEVMIDVSSGPYNYGDRMPTRAILGISYGGKLYAAMNTAFNSSGRCHPVSLPRACRGMEPSDYQTEDYHEGSGKIGCDYKIRPAWAACPRYPLYGWKPATFSQDVVDNVVKYWPFATEALVFANGDAYYTDSWMPPKTARRGTKAGSNMLVNEASHFCANGAWKVRSCEDYLAAVLFEADCAIQPWACNPAKFPTMPPTNAPCNASLCTAGTHVAKAGTCASDPCVANEPNCCDPLPKCSANPNLCSAQPNWVPKEGDHLCATKACDTLADGMKCCDPLPNCSSKPNVCPNATHTNKPGDPHCAVCDIATCCDEKPVEKKCSDFDGNKRGCREAGAGYAPPETCTWNKIRNKCKGYTCADMPQLGIRCEKKARKFSMQCYFDIKSKVCNEAMPQYQCADYEADGKKFCRKLTRFHKLECTWDKKKPRGGRCHA